MKPLQFQFWKNDTEAQTTKVLDNFHNHFSQLLKTSDITVVIKKTRKSPSDNQRGYIWKYLIPTINKEMYSYGNEYTDEECYQILKERGKFYKIEKLKVKEKEVEQKVLDTFSNYGDKKMVSKFIDWAIRWSAEYLGIVLETPEEFKLNRGIK